VVRKGNHNRCSAKEKKKYRPVGVPCAVLRRAGGEDKREGAHLRRMQRKTTLNLCCGELRRGGKKKRKEEEKVHRYKHEAIHKRSLVLEHESCRCKGKVEEST